MLTRLAAGEAIGTELDRRDDDPRRAQAVACRSRPCRRPADARCRRGAGIDARRQEPVADRVSACQGRFERGEIVGCFDADGREIARGLINYSGSETQRILRQAVIGDRSGARLRRRARTDPSGQPGFALNGASAAGTRHLHLARRIVYENRVCT